MTVPDPVALLQQTTTQQAGYDQHAGTWQRCHFRWRLAVLVLGILTALLGVLSRTGIVTDLLGPALPVLLFGMPGLAVVLMLLIYVVNPGQRWVAYRAGSESLKTEAYLFATGAEKYTGHSAEMQAQLYQQRLASIDALVIHLQPRGLLSRLATAWRNWWTPAAPLAQADAPYTPGQQLDPDSYLQQRLLPQRDWYHSRGLGHRANQGWLSAGIILFNLVAGVLVLVNQVEWIPVATTIVGALATYSALSNSEFLSNSYRQTVLQLDQLHEAWKRGDYGKVPNGFQRFVLHVEQVIAREYTGWVQVQPEEATR